MNVTAIFPRFVKALTVVVSSIGSTDLSRTEPVLFYVRSHEYGHSSSLVVEKSATANSNYCRLPFGPVDNKNS